MSMFTLKQLQTLQNCVTVTLAALDEQGVIAEDVEAGLVELYELLAYEQMNWEPHIEYTPDPVEERELGIDLAYDKWKAGRYDN